MSFLLIYLDDIGSYCNNFNVFFNKLKKILSTITVDNFVGYFRIGLLTYEPAGIFLSQSNFHANIVIC